LFKIEGRWFFERIPKINLKEFNFPFDFVKFNCDNSDSPGQRSRLKNFQTGSPGCRDSRGSGSLFHVVCFQTDRGEILTVPARSHWPPAGRDGGGSVTDRPIDCTVSGYGDRGGQMQAHVDERENKNNDIYSVPYQSYHPLIFLISEVVWKRKFPNYLRKLLMS